MGQPCAIQSQPFISDAKDDDVIGGQPNKVAHARPALAASPPHQAAHGRFAAMFNQPPAALTTGPAPAQQDLSELFAVSEELDGLYYHYSNNHTMEAFGGTLTDAREFRLEIENADEAAWSNGFRSLMLRLVEDQQPVSTLAMTWLPNDPATAHLQEPLYQAVGATWVAQQFADFGFTQVRSTTRRPDGAVNAVFQRPLA